MKEHGLIGEVKQLKQLPDYPNIKPDLLGKIQETAYLIWEREGCPDGRQLDHWLQAEAEISAAD